MKTYNSTNFFKHTFCEFQQVDDFTFLEKTNYKSKSESSYFYTDEGVYRKSNHWGRVANCRWKLISNENYKNQQIVIGFAKWIDFYPINSSEKIFFIDVNKPKFNDSQRAYYIGQKSIAAIDILLGRGARKTAIELAEKTLRQVLKFEYTEVSVNLLKKLSRHYGAIEKNKKKSYIAEYL